MSKYYRGKRTRNLYEPGSDKPFRISRSKIDDFIKCPRCFYIDRRLGIGQPPGFPFAINSAVDHLLKKEFDECRTKQEPHPIFVESGLDAVPYQHDDIDLWRDSLRGGIKFVHESTNLEITGGVDDVWINPQGELLIADYKATAKEKDVTIDEEWQDGYKRQMEVYQWLFRKNGFKVSNTGYFVYCNGDLNQDRFDSRVVFKVSLLPYEGDDSWVENTIESISQCLNSDEVPEHSEDCDFCTYNQLIQEL